ncbi:MAG: D-aminoacyl-tRNA deacylase [Bacillota bacterium]|nr:D-aminoacyl-tRNA deacylase [Bacillota bacterium]
MRALLQRVGRASVCSEGSPCGAIQAGLLVFLGVAKEDGEEDAAFLARKTANLRIFEDENGKMNLSVKDIQGSALVVSQFTLYSDTSRGNRPSFEQAADPKSAEQLYRRYVELLRAEGLPVETGVFQTDMQVELLNEGPVTLLLESRKK